MNKIMRKNLISELSEDLANCSEESLDISNEFLRRSLSMWFIDRLEDKGVLNVGHLEEGMYYIQNKEQNN